MDDKTLTYATPMLILFQQPLSVTVAWENSQNSDAEVTVIISFHAELSLQPVACKRCILTIQGVPYVGGKYNGESKSTTGSLYDEAFICCG